MQDASSLAYDVIEGLQPKPPKFAAAQIIDLPAAALDDHVSLHQALVARRSTRTFSDTPIDRPILSNLLWAADGINRRDIAGRTAPSAGAHHDIDIYVALPEGVYRYDPFNHRLVLKSAIDARNLTGYQDFVGDAPLDLIYVACAARSPDILPQLRSTFSAVKVGAIAQNVYLYCASAGLATVARGWINRRVLADALGLADNERPILAQTVGKFKDPIKE